MNHQFFFFFFFFLLPFQVLKIEIQKLSKIPLEMNPDNTHQPQPNTNVQLWYPQPKWVICHQQFLCILLFLVQLDFFFLSSCMWEPITKRNGYNDLWELASSHSRIAASASTSIKPWRPFGGRYRGHSVMMWFAVCWSAPQSQAGLLDNLTVSLEQLLTCQILLGFHKNKTHKMLWKP